MDDLFDVFSEAPTEPVAHTAADPKKRLASDLSDEESRPQQAAAKQQKAAAKESVNPVVADEVEIEASREVKASSGLLGAAGEDEARGPVKLSHQVRHQVAVPPDYPYVPISEHRRTNEARTYPFTLDPFQDTAISCIDRNESVLVSAHTSAGKTVVAEYAIAQSLRDKQRVIYTSPIKALSNQKYRELLAEFGDVGLMTGDVTINPDAGCLVMTTEILRSMLYRGSEIMREISWVIFDEVHYMRDKSRGVVWEETIILLPDKVHHVFLSATIPNAMEFAEWICQIHAQPCHVVYTDFRPTPLQHYLFPADGDGIHLVVDEKGTFREENFQKAMASISNKLGDDPGSADRGRGKKGQTYKGGQKGGNSDIYKIVKMIWLKKYNPVIVFSFSKRDCESLALKMSKLDFNTDDERAALETIFNNAIGLLNESDRALPQIKHILPLLRRGIGIHHSGLLPILKEIIEVLFQEGFLKVLFATETFSIGLNMPAKTVVFTSVRKWDGVGFRWVSGGEYIQMSGRAGRRGLDDRGIVIMMIDEKMEPQVAKGMVKGVADRLDSAFHLGYNMILNLMRVEGISPEFMLEHSFFQFQSCASVPVLERRVGELEARRDEIEIADEPTVRDYHDLRKQLAVYQADIRHIVTHPSNVLQYLQGGRMVKVKVGSQDYGWGVIIDYAKRNAKRNSAAYTDHQQYLVYVFVTTMFVDSPVNLIKLVSPDIPEGIRPAKEGEKTRAEVIPVTLESLEALSNIRLFLPEEAKRKPINTASFGKVLAKTIREVGRRYPDGVPLLDPIKNMKIDDPDFVALTKKAEVIESRLQANPLSESDELRAEYDLYCEKVALAEEIEATRAKITEVRSAIQLDDLRHRKRVLRRLGLASQADIIELKGRVACEISSGDELLLTELIFSGSFNELTPEQCAAVLSCFVFEERSKEVPRLRPELAEPLKVLREMASRIAKISKEAKIEITEKDYVEGFRSELMEVVYAWAKGSTFTQICQMTDVYEGSLIRMFKRLEELLRQMTDAAKVIGNTALFDKMEKARELIHRDIVSAGSLYL